MWGGEGMQRAGEAARETGMHMSREAGPGPGVARGQGRLISGIRGLHGKLV